MLTIDASLSSILRRAKGALRLVEASGDGGCESSGEDEMADEESNGGVADVRLEGNGRHGEDSGLVVL